MPVKADQAFGRVSAPWLVVSWAQAVPRTIQSGAKTAAGKRAWAIDTSKPCSATLPRGRPRPTPSSANAYRRIVKRRGKLKALVAVARSTLVIVWHLLSNPGLRYRDLGSDYFTNRIDREREPATTSVNSKGSVTRSSSASLPDQTNSARSH